MASGSRDEGPAPVGVDQVAVVGALAEPTRRLVYERVVGLGGWVGRDQAADEVGLPRATVAHHLDRLVEAGLLEVSYRRLTERSGPGAGRPAKLYRRAGGEVVVSLPPRDYGLAAELLARVVLAAGADGGAGEGGGVLAAVREVAAAEGRVVAEEMRERYAGSGPGPGSDGPGADGPGADGVEARRAVVVEVLAGHGYEPVVRDGMVLLRNCPFHRLSRQYRELVCGMNVDLLASAVEGFGGTGLSAGLDPREGYCCVTLTPADRSGGSDPVGAGAA